MTVKVMTDLRFVYFTNCLIVFISMSFEKQHFMKHYTSEHRFVQSISSKDRLKYMMQLLRVDQYHTGGLLTSKKMLTIIVRDDTTAKV